jgi:hypothetical protein
VSVRGLRYGVLTGAMHEHERALPHRRHPSRLNLAT